MPMRDGTGPEGKGPNTGRGFGPCETKVIRGAGRGMGRRNATPGVKLDGTGPNGEGPKTGRGLGNCD